MIKYWFFDVVELVEKNFDSLQEAQIALEQMKSLYLQQNDFRFPLARVVVDGNNTTWTAVNDDSPEEGEYHVFNHNIGQYEPIGDLTAAKARVEELKQSFLTDMRFQVHERTDAQQPKTSGTQNL